MMIVIFRKRFFSASFNGTYYATPFTIDSFDSSFFDGSNRTDFTNAISSVDTTLDTPALSSTASFILLP
jgi:hypothetical protein